MKHTTYALSTKIVAASSSCFVLYHEHISNWWCAFMFLFVAFMDDKKEKT